VLIVENDESAELLRSHRDKVGLPDRLLVANTDVIWDADGKKFNKEFGELLYYYMPDVVIIDAYTSLGIPDITRPESALVLDELRRLAKSHTCAIVVIHHTNLRGEQMGSNLHRVKMDSMVCLSKVSENRVMLTQDKIRGSKFQPKVITFNQDTLEMKDANMSLKQQVQELQGIGLTTDEIVGKFPKSQRDTVKRYLR
jgi:RecA-family ATPase